VKILFALFFLIITNLVFAKSIEYLPVPASDLVRHKYYTLSYNEKYEQANWVCYTLTDSMILNGGAERSNKFKVDILVSTGSAKSADYTKSGYDRGHLCPAADMGFNPVAMEESFLMSNMSPQKPEFNRGIWKELETTVRRWAKVERQIVVVAGPIFKDTKGTIGKENVMVPGYFFKIILDATNEPRMIAFVFPNEKSNRPITDFAVTADEAEKLTGYDFFSQLPDDIETRLESRVELAGWFPGYTSTEPTVAEQPEKKDSYVKDKSDFNFYLILVIVVLLVAIFVFANGRKRK
jgi:endonuclease G